MIRATGREVYEILKRRLKYTDDEFVVSVAWRKSGNPFIILVSIILSQNTSDKNSIKALNNYLKIVGETCEDAQKTPLEVIQKAIRPAGLYRQKALTIKRLALEYCSNWDKIKREKNIESIKKWLLSIPGIGRKTADVFLQLVYNAPAFAVDTHASRIARRWELVGEKASYEETSNALLEFFGPELAGEAHRLLIVLGRRLCKARNPRCKECPLRRICPYAQRRSS